MAITNAQQAKQIMKEGGPMRKIRGQDHMLAYITPSEKDILVELGGRETMTPEGILAYPPEGNYGSEAKGPGSGPGKSGITGMASTGGANFSSGNNVGNVGSSTGPKGTGKVSPPTTVIGGEEYPVLVNDLENIKKRQEAEERAAAQREREKDNFITTDNTPSYVPSYLKFLAGNNSVNRKFFYDKVVAAGKIPGLNYGEDDLEQAYQDYMNNRMAGKTDAYGNPTQGFSYDIDETGKYDLTGNFIDDRDDGAGQQNLLDDTIEDKEDEEDEVNPRDYTGLAPRFMGSIFDFTGLAEGGRVAAQRGGIMSQQGGIMPRLNNLSGDVSSAEQMLQEINQRLNSAESTLGEGGAMQQPALQQPGLPGLGMSPLENAMRLGQLPLGQPGLASIANYTPFAGETFGQDQIPEQYKAGFDEFKKGKIMMGGQAMTAVGLPDGNRVMFGNTGTAGVFDDYLKSIGQGVSPIGTAIDSGIRQGAMDGGRMRQMEMMEDEDDPTGGIMDLESGRQMYFLGKLVKKAGRAIKKVVKSPIGKAALLYFGGNALMGAGGGKGLGSFFGKGSFNPLKTLITTTAQDGAASGMGLSKLGQIFNKFGLATGEGALTLGGKLGLSFGVPFALDALGVGKDKDKDGPINYGLDIDIDAIRANPYKFLPAGIIGSNYQTGTEGRKDGGRMGYQEGGDAEPVAKKTMPLLDMNGMEKDYREDGGFVPIGRMERADDVPARLSKNEFVFTADAVRNAGEGDIDKGAEVMYNMMKNLESGGEVSEESQGLDGAREMFQTSKRLEEVL